MARQIIHYDDVAQLELGDEDLLDINLEGVPVDRTIEDKGAAIPLSRRPATKVVVFQ